MPVTVGLPGWSVSMLSICAAESVSGGDLMYGDRQRIDGQDDTCEREKERKDFVWLRLMKPFMTLHSRATMSEWHQIVFDHLHT